MPEAERPRPLYVRERLSQLDKTVLEELGWAPSDVRLIRDRSDRVRATLEGASMGTIILDANERKNVEMEARVCGLLGNKATDDGPQEYFDGQTWRELMEIGGTPKDGPTLNWFIKDFEERRHRMRGIYQTYRGKQRK